MGPIWMNWEKGANKTKVIQREKEKWKQRENENKSPLKIKVYRKPQSFGKAFRKSFTPLPHSPRKRKAVVVDLAKSFRLKPE